MPLTAVQFPDIDVATSAEDTDRVFVWRVGETGNSRRATITKANLLSGIMAGDGTIPLWSSGSTYSIGAFVRYSGVVYWSRTSSNLNNQPDEDVEHWHRLEKYRGDATTSSTWYAKGDIAQVDDDGTERLYLVTVDVQLTPMQFDASSSTTEISNHQRVVKYVTALPDPSDVAEADYGKLYAVRANDTSPISELAHLAPHVASTGTLSAQEDPSNAGRIGFASGYGHLTGYLNVTQLYTRPSGTHRIMVLHVASSGTIPRESGSKSVYFRGPGRPGTGSQWRLMTLRNGGDGVYESFQFDSTEDRFWLAGSTYDIAIVNGGNEQSDETTHANPPTNNRYDFFPDDLKWNTFADSDDVLSGNVQLSVFNGRIGTPFVTSGDAFPQSPNRDDLHVFNASATGITAKSFNGTSSVTTAARGDAFKFTTEWVKQWASGTGSGGGGVSGGTDLREIDLGSDGKYDFNSTDSALVLLAEEEDNWYELLVPLAELSSTQKNFMIDSFNPAGTASDNRNLRVGSDPRQRQQSDGDGPGVERGNGL